MKGISERAPKPLTRLSTLFCSHRVQRENYREQRILPRKLNTNLKEPGSHEPKTNSFETQKNEIQLQSQASLTFRRSERSWERCVVQIPPSSCHQMQSHEIPNQLSEQMPVLARFLDML